MTVTCTTTHRKFPPLPSTQPLPHLTLQLNSYLPDEFRRRYNREPQFSAEWVDFGYEEESDEMVVMAWLEGTDYLAHWAFGRLLEGDGRHALESGCPEEETVGEGAEEAREIFGGMRWELAAQGNAS
ncbi:hypothetical protein HYALB_00009195 [Hymenoscyphus albidus]|uniref:Uncharacterized protein n=1 Tax=Hymenoscyphus albidus TaxID=595503 RepID=A0A9N9Q6V1_9HELO|nr:hypothetical protein HYALB_00009195 [Hymenoscyphus albidus]